MLSLACNIQTKRCAACWCKLPCGSHVLSFTVKSTRQLLSTRALPTVCTGSWENSVGMSAHELQVGRWH